MAALTKKHKSLFITLIVASILSIWVSDASGLILLKRFLTPGPVTPGPLVNNCQKPPSAPSNLQVIQISPEKGRLSWIDNSSDEYGFVIFRSWDNVDWHEQIAWLSENATEFIDEDFNEMYWYKIRAYNICGDSSEIVAKMYREQISTPVATLILPGATLAPVLETAPLTHTPTQVPVIAIQTNTPTSELTSEPITEPDLPTPSIDRSSNLPFLSSSRNIIVFNNPNENSNPIKIVEVGNAVEIIGKTQDLLWWKIRCPQNTLVIDCWVKNTSDLVLNLGEHQIPILEGPLESESGPVVDPPFTQTPDTPKPKGGSGNLMCGSSLSIIFVVTFVFFINSRKWPKR